MGCWYCSYLNQFIQPDTIIPQPGNSGDWNRYAYVLYNPANFNDPTGHYVPNPDDDVPLIDGEWDPRGWINYSGDIHQTADEYETSRNPPTVSYDFILPSAGNYLLDQGSGNDCGPTALAMALNYLAGDPDRYSMEFLSAWLTLTNQRLNYNLADLVPTWGGDTTGATFPHNMWMAANEFFFMDGGISGYATYNNNNTVDDIITALVETGNPVTVLLDLESSLHWVNVVGYNADEIIYQDPGNPDILRYEKSKIFNGWFTDPIPFDNGPYRGFMITYKD